MENKQVILKIHGRVQGVFYRDSARKKARKFNLTGWAKNRNNGSVIIKAQGEKENLKKFIDWCYNGPILAKVDKIEIKWEEIKKPLNSFGIKH